MNSRGPSRRRRPIKYYVRTDDPLHVLVYDALQSLCAASGTCMTQVSWKLSILGLLAACGDDPRPLARRLGLRQPRSIDSIRAILRTSAEGSTVDNATANAVSREPQQRADPRREFEAAGQTGRLPSVQTEERDDLQKQHPRPFDLQRLLNVGQVERKA